MNKFLLKLVLLVFLLTSTYLLHAQGQLWGMTSRGGTDGEGVIFTTAGDGTGLVVRKNLNSTYPGADPAYSKLTEVNGKLYGFDKRWRKL